MSTNVTLRNQYEHFIGGEWVPPSGGQYFSGINPSNGATQGRFARGNALDIERAVRAAQAAQVQWAATDAFKRGQVLHRVAQLLRLRALALDGEGVIPAFGMKQAGDQGCAQNVPDLLPGETGAQDGQLLAQIGRAHV